MQIEQLNLSVRSYNALKRAGINTLQDLSKYSDDDLTEIRNMSRKGWEEIVYKRSLHVPRLEVAHIVPNEPDWMLGGLILLGKTGSHAYGTNTPESDTDYKGVCIPPTSYFLGLDSFKGYDKTGGKNFKNTANDVDVTILHVNKFVRDALEGVPNNLELLYLDKSDYLFLDGFGLDLVNERHEFLSKRVFKKFGGFARSQKVALDKSYNAQTGEYDTKMLYARGSYV